MTFIIITDKKTKKKSILRSRLKSLTTIKKNMPKSIKDNFNFKVVTKQEAQRILQRG